MNDQLSFDDIRSLLATNLNSSAGGMGDSTMGGRYWVRDVYATSFVYQDETNGKLYRRPYVISQANQVTLGDATEVVQETRYEPVKMAAFDFGGDYEEDADYITVRGKIFEVGNYPDKNFSLSEEEARQAVANFTPVKLDLEHTSTPLDGKLGMLEAVELSENGKEIIGTVRLPKWLDHVLADMPRKVSSTWNRATKRLAGLALVNKPRVSDAILMSAFSEFAGKRNSGSDQSHLQEAHDHLVSAGAVCEPDPATMSTTINPDAGVAPTASTAATHQTEVNPQMADTTTNTDNNGGNQNQIDAAKFAAMEQRIAAQDAALARMADERRHNQAAQFSIDMVRDGRVAPFAGEMITRIMEQALRDDENKPEVVAFANFSQAGQQINSRAMALVAFFSGLPKTPMLQELVTSTGEITNAAKGLTALFDSNSTGQKSEEEAAKERQQGYLEMTSLGRKAAEAEKK